MGLIYTNITLSNPVDLDLKPMEDMDLVVYPALPIAIGIKIPVNPLNPNMAVGIVM